MATSSRSHGSLYGGGSINGNVNNAGSITMIGLILNGGVTNSGTISGNGTINGNLTQTPTGIFNGGGAINGNVNNAGSFIMNGLIVPDAIQNTETVSGNGTVNGNFVNGGIFVPGGSATPTGTLTVGGNFTQTSGGTFILMASASTQYNHLAVNGTTALGGTLIVEGINGYGLNFGDKYTFINSANSISGDFSSIEIPGTLTVPGSSLPGIPRRPSKLPLSAILSGAEPQPEPGGHRPQQLRFRDQWRSGVVSSLLDNLALSQYQQAYQCHYADLLPVDRHHCLQCGQCPEQRTGPAALGTEDCRWRRIQHERTAGEHPMVQEQGKGVLDSRKDILRPGSDSHWGLFVDGNGIFAQANSASKLPNYKSESGGITTGLTYKWNSSFGTGIYCGYEGSYTKLGAAGSGLGVGSSLIDNSVRFGAFGTWGQKNSKGEAVGFYANALAGGGYNNYQANRVIQFTGLNRTASSSPGAGELDTMLAGGYDIKSR